MLKPLRYAVVGLSALAAMTASLSTPAQAGLLSNPTADRLVGSDGPTPYSRHFHPRATDPLELRQAWHRWKSLHQRDYNLRVDKACFCQAHPPVVTKVRNGKVVAVFYANRRHHELARKGWTMDRLFYLQRHAYHQADRVHVKYGRHGAPTRIAIDYIKRAIDDEIYYHNSLWLVPRLLTQD